MNSCGSSPPSPLQAKMKVGIRGPYRVPIQSGDSGHYTKVERKSARVSRYVLRAVVIGVDLRLN